MKTRWFPASCVIALLPLSCGAQALLVQPAQVMTDQVADVRATGLAAGAHVVIRAELVDGEGHPWNSQAEFVADASGTVDLATQAPVKGSYKSVSAMGLVWSMAPGEKGVPIYRPPALLAPQTITFHLLEDGKEISRAQLQQNALGEGVREVKLEGALVGRLFLPAGVDKHAGVLVLGGSEGGMPVRRAAWLASHGYAALALCYFHCEGRPPDLERIPLEYFGQALGWLSHREEVNANELAVMGVSRGGELALQLGSMFPAIKVVVAYVPANIRYPSCCGGLPLPSWTWQGQPLTYAGPRTKNDPPMRMHATIPVEHIQGPVLMIAGRSDGVWPSSEMVVEAASRLRSAHFTQPVVVLDYDHAGHRAGLPEIMPVWTKGATHPVAGTPVDYGGTAEGNAASTLDAIPKVLDFLRSSLKVNGEPASGDAVKAAKPAEASKPMD